MGIHKIDEMRANSLFHDIAVPIGKEIFAIAEIAHRPLHLWNNSVQEITFLKRKRDIFPVYKQLVERLDQNCYEQ